MNRFENVKPGDEVYCIEGDDFSIFLFMAVCSDYVIVTTEYYMIDFEDQLKNMSEESVDCDGVTVNIFPKDKVWLTSDEVLAHLK